MMVIECTPYKKRIRQAEKTGEGWAVCAVNSFRSEEMKPYDFAKGEDYNSAGRYQTVMESCRRRMRGDPVEEAQRLLRGEYGFMCQYDEEPDFETVWSSVFDLKSLVIYRRREIPEGIHLRKMRGCAPGFQFVHIKKPISPPGLFQNILLTKLPHHTIEMAVACPDGVSDIHHNIPEIFSL